MNKPDKHLAERLSLWLIGLMWVLPFLSPRHQLPISSFYGELTAFVLGMLAMCGLWKKEVWQEFQLPRITLLPFGILAVILLQMALGMIVFPQMALIGMQYLLWACLLMVLGHRLRMVLGWEKLATTLAWFLVVGGLINVAMATLQYSGVKSLWLFPGISARPFGNLGQPNHFANYMALATGSLIYLFISKRLQRIAFTGLALLFLAMLALSASRSSWFYLLAFAALAWLKQHSATSRENRQLLLVCLALLPAFALTQTMLHWLLDWWGGGTPIMATERFFQQVSGASVRLRLWQDALQMFLAHPWLGVGYSQFPWNSFLLAGTHATGEFSQPAEHAHNLLFHLLAEMGLFAGLLLIGFVWVWIKSAIKETFTLERWWMWALLAVLGIHSLLEYPLWYAFFLGIAAMLLGAGEARFLQPDFSRIGRVAVIAISVLGLTSMLNIAQSYATLEEWTDRGLHRAIQSSELKDMHLELEQLHRNSLLSPYVTLIYAAFITPDGVMTSEKLKLVERAVHFAPLRKLVFRYGVLLALTGEKEKAREQLSLSLKAYPEDVAKLKAELKSLGLTDLAF